ncbi:MAG: hypothetical protein KC419_18740 [Anaerolineales bacterium]|nr:hypothetical protein [Anaerolineales bacterium]MCA9930532.1 hypothetical protein [Anaerolineales bacterium]
MMKEGKSKLTLYQPATYQIRVLGDLGESSADWVAEMMVSSECQGDSPPITTLIVTVDQAALQSLLRRLYSLGRPLISVKWVEVGCDETV